MPVQNHEMFRFFYLTFQWNLSHSFVFILRMLSTFVFTIAICDIGTASFKYDMRRLSEILSLPKAWYRRTLARRLFLGDDSMNVNPGDGDYAHFCVLFVPFSSRFTMSWLEY